MNVSLQSVSYNDLLAHWMMSRMFDRTVITILNDGSEEFQRIVAEASNRPIEHHDLVMLEFDTLDQAQEYLLVAASNLLPAQLWHLGHLQGTHAW